MTKMSRRLVVDASVARSAGTTEDPTSRHCRQFLAAMLTICHKVVMTDDIEKEWRKHSSGYSTLWLAAMQRRRKLVRVMPDEECNRKIYARLQRARDLITQYEEGLTFYRRQVEDIRYELGRLDERLRGEQS